MTLWLIGLAIMVTTSACKRPMESSAETTPTNGPSLLPKRPAPTLEEGLGTSWTELRVACARFVECAGYAPGDHLIIRRDNDGMVISGSHEIALGESREIAGHPLAKDQFDEIVGRLRYFHDLAKAESAEVKAFDSFPSGQRERELATYYELQGRPHLRRDSHVFHVWFNPGGGPFLTESFMDPRSAKEYVGWLRSMWNALDAGSEGRK